MLAAPRKRAAPTEPFEQLCAEVKRLLAQLPSQSDAIKMDAEELRLVMTPQVCDDLRRAADAAEASVGKMTRQLAELVPRPPVASYGQSAWTCISQWLPRAACKQLALTSHAFRSLVAQSGRITHVCLNITRSLDIADMDHIVGGRFAHLYSHATRLTVVCQSRSMSNDTYARRFARALNALLASTYQLNRVDLHVLFATVSDEVRHKTPIMLPATVVVMTDNVPGGWLSGTGVVSAHLTETSLTRQFRLNRMSLSPPAYENMYGAVGRACAANCPNVRALHLSALGSCSFVDGWTETGGAGWNYPNVRTLFVDIRFLMGGLHTPARFGALSVLVVEALTPVYVEAEGLQGTVRLQCSPASVQAEVLARAAECVRMVPATCRIFLRLKYWLPSDVGAALDASESLADQLGRVGRNVYLCHQSPYGQLAKRPEWQPVDDDDSLDQNFIYALDMVTGTPRLALMVLPPQRRPSVQVSGLDSPSM